MAFHCNYEPFTILSLLKNISKPDITLILELLENKTSEDVHKSVLKIKKLFTALNDAKVPMDHYDLLYWYCNMKLLSNSFQSLESKAMTGLKGISTHYCCSKCKKNVLINYNYSLIDNLEAHNCEQPVLLDHRMDRASSLQTLKEYDLCWTVHYPHDIKEKLFFKTTLNNTNEIIYLYTIYIFNEVYLCLVCGCEISGPNNVMQHVYGQRHVKALSEDFGILKAYHQHFANLKPELQILQENFSLVDNTRTKCTVCKKNVLFTDLRNHLNGKCFKKHTVNINRTSNGTSVNYHTIVEITIYKGLLDWCICIDNVRYPVFQNIENKIYCLVCNTNVKNHITLHIESQPHQEKQSSKKAVESLKKYHQMWSSQKVHIQIEQVNFRKREQKITCTVCSNYIPYSAKALTEHVESADHKKCLMSAVDSWQLESQPSRSHSSRSTSIDAERNSPLSTSSSSSNIGNYSKTGTVIKNISNQDGSNCFPSLYSDTTDTARIVPYDKLVLDELYSDGLLNFTVTIGSTKYPTIIKRGNYKHCLVCNVDIPSFVLLHANSTQHAESIASERRCDLVKKFHDVWVNLPHTDQCRQAFFKAEDRLTCVLCEKALNYDVEELKSHINSWEHVLIMMNTHNGLERVPWEEIPIADSTSEASQTDISKPITTKPMSLQDMLNNSKLPSPAKKSGNINESATQQAETNPLKSDNPTYSKEILDKFYGEESKHYYVRIKNIKYPFIQNMGVYKRCLICNFELVSGVLLHVNSAPHIQATNDAEKMQLLQKYHNLWMSVSVQNQEEQKYFNVGEKLVCVPCRIELEYDTGALSLHLSSAGHVNKMVVRRSTSSDKLEKSKAELHGSNASTIDGKSASKKIAKVEVIKSVCPPTKLSFGDSSNAEVFRGDLLQYMQNNYQISQESNNVKYYNFSSIPEIPLAAYEKAVMESLYSNLTHYTVLVDNTLYPCIQNRHNSLFCLLCREFLSDINYHVVGIKHARRLKEKDLLNRVKFFHELFLPLSLPQQMEQIYFLPKPNQLTCLLCGIHCQTSSNIATHICEELHKKQVQKKEKTNKIAFATYEKAAMESIYLNLTEYTVVVDNVLYPCIQNRGRSLYCLLCWESLPDIASHINSVEHTNRLKNKQLLNKMKFFHEQFLPLSSSLQMEQIYFHPRRVTCLLCGVHCCGSIVNHICGERHKKQIQKREKIQGTHSLDASNTTERGSSICSLDELNRTQRVNDNLGHDWRDGDHFSHESNSVKYYIYSTMQDISSLATYDETVMESVYLNLTQYTFLVGDISYLYLQNRRDSLFCLICREPLTHIDNHIESEEHLQRTRHPHTSQQLKQYHEQFLSLPPALQIQQIYFHPKRTKCLPCGIRCRTLERLIAHLISKQHSDIIGKTRLLMYEKNSSGDAESASNTSPASNIFEDLINTKTLSEDPFQYWDNNYQLSQEPNCVKYYICSSVSEIPLAAYDKTIMEAIYSNLTQYTVVVDNVSYPYIQIKDDSLFCLICEMSLPNVDQHVNSKKHTKKLKDQQLLKTIKDFHDQFLCLSLPHQMEQIYFVPKDIACLLCGITCHTSSNIMAHICEEGHRKEVQKREETIGKSNKAGRYFNVAADISLNGLNRTNAENKSLARDCRDEFHFSQESDSINYSTIPEIDESKYDALKKFNDFVRNANSLDVDIIRCLPNGQFICLVCQTEIKNLFNFAHISSEHHRTKLALPSSIDRIRIYYNKWKRVDTEFAACQDAFFPVTRSFTFCFTCGINIDYAQLNEHLKRFHPLSDCLDITSLQDKLDPDFYVPSRKEYCQEVLESLYRENVEQCNIIMEGISYPVIQNLDNNMRCLLCYKSITGDKFAHLSSKEHIANVICHQARNKLKNYHDTWMDGNEEFQMEQMYFEKDREYYCKICLVDVKVTDLLKHISGNEHKASLNEFHTDQCISKEANTSQDGETSSRAENTGYSQGDEDYNTDSDTDDSNNVPSQYPKQILEELYVDYKKHHVNINGVQYPIFRKTVVGVKCMICKRSPDVTSVEQHAALERHRNRLTARTGQNKLMKFHDAWMKLDPSVQMHQKYFHVIKCIPCDVQVDYDSITAHVQSDSCERKMESFKATKKDLVSALSNMLNNSKQHLIGDVSTSHKNEGKKADKSKSVNNKKISHNIRKAIPDHNSTNILSGIPLRYSKHVKFLNDDTNDLQCKCCCSKLIKEIAIIKEHLDSANHLKISNVPRRKMKYHCEICNKRYGLESSWDKHLVDLAHSARFESLGKTRKERITEYECLTCDTVIFGDEISLKRHCAMSSKKKKAKELVLPKTVITLFESRRMINQNLEKLINEADEASESQDKEREVCLALVRTLKEIYPKCKAYPFGSRVTGLGYVDSDLDVFLDIGDMYYGNHLQDAEDQADIVKTVAKMLQKHKASFSDINKVAGARTPIVQVFHKDTEIDCDISFRHGLSVENTAFIRLCLDLQPALRPAMLYLKEWYAATNMHGISSYALTILMIFYLQTKGYLLSVRELRRINPEKSHVIDGWDTIKHTASLQKMKEYVSRCDYNVIELLESFFEYYAKFDFTKWVICPLMGYLIVKPDFNGLGENLPIEMQRYKEKLRGKNPECFRNLTPMCVQDPFDLSHNLTKACSHDTVKKLQGYCSLSKNHLSALN